MLLDFTRKYRLWLLLSGVLLGFLDSASADLLHRWTFHRAAGPAEAGTTIIDSVHGAPAVVKGNGAIFDGTSLILPGTTDGTEPHETISAYVDLPNGLVSSHPDLTVEIWMTPLPGFASPRVFDFGRCYGPGDGLGAPGEWTGALGASPPEHQAGNNYLTLIAQTVSDINWQLAAMRFDFSVVGNAEAHLAGSYGTLYHYVLTFQDKVGYFGENGGVLKWYRDGVLGSEVHVPFHLRNIEDVNNWLGRSNWTSEPNTHASYRELRIYDQAFSPAQVSASFAAGPDAEIPMPPPVAQVDEVTMHRGQKALIEVLKNDTGLIDPASLTIVQPPAHGTAVLDGKGAILYTQTSGNPSSDEMTYRISNYTGTISAEGAIAIHFANSLRVPAPHLQVPATPPPTDIQVVPAFGSLVFKEITTLATAPGDSARLWVGQRSGLVELIPDVTAAIPARTIFLDLPAVLASRGQGETFPGWPYGEYGLLGLAFHPQFSTNGHFFVNYTVTIAGTWYQRVSRFSVMPGQPEIVDADSERILIQQLDRDGNHNGGDIHFGPDGYLYISLGDEGSQYDGFQNSQRIDLNFFSGLLRIDVDQKPGNLLPNPHPAVPTDAGVARYSIPVDNPFVGSTSFNGLAVASASVRTEFWAVGLRSPWRFSFDEATGELWCGDVGQDVSEEVNLITKGGNYGWSFRDGSRPGFPGSREIPPGFQPIAPLYEYFHTEGTDSNFLGSSITGGYVYRGTRIPSLMGSYLFADYMRGNIWSLRRNGEAVNVQRIAGFANIATFGVDPSNGDILVASYGLKGISRLTAEPAASVYPQKLSDTKLFADLSDLSPSPGVLPYSVNLPFWSDFAEKRRWFVLPGTERRLDWEREGPWNYPSGMVLIKHFDLPLNRDNPATKKRIETRLLVKTETGSYGVSYRWNEAQTDADLVPDGGADIPLTVVENGVPRTQQWHIPSRAECSICHNAAAGDVLSFKTRQLNRGNTINGFTGNQIGLLQAHGFIYNSTESPQVLPRHVRPDETGYSVEARARSYLAVNCSPCHRDEGTAPQWDARPSIPLASTGLINGVALANGGDPANKLIVPGSPGHSVVSNRMAAANGFTRMPPIGSNELDAAGIALINEWIGQSLPNRVTYQQWRMNRFESDDSSESDPEADPEADGRTNQMEFLLGSDPFIAGSVDTPQLMPEAGTMGVVYAAPPNRVVQVETSTDLLTWSLWDVPGNDGVPRDGGVLSLAGPVNESRRFFRLKVREE